MTALASFVTGRRTKWLVPLVWLLLFLALAPLAGRLGDETEDTTENFLPESAESTEVVRLLEDRFPGGQTVNGLIVYQREGGLTRDDREKIADDAGRAKAELPLIGEPLVPFQANAPPGLVSADGNLAYATVSLEDDYKEVGGWGKDLREITGDGEDGLNVWVTGDLGFNSDFEEVFAGLDVTLLSATVILVLVLLLAIYRAPLIALLPLVSVFFAALVAQAFVYLYAKSGADVGSNSTFILIVLMFGVGTDYCLLLVSRYREELRRFEDKHDAMRRALKRTGPAIIASGLTVALTMLVLLVADTGSIKSLGPVAAIGVVCVMLSALTLLPALLTIVGRRGFWPRRGIVAYRADDADVEREGIWQRVGERVLKRPGLALGVTSAAFALAALGLLTYKEDYSTSNAFKNEVESVEGYDALQEAFPAGTLSPTNVLIVSEAAPVSDALISDVTRTVGSVRGVARVASPAQRSEDGRIARLDVTLDDDPFTSGALNTIPRLRRSLDDVGADARVLVGGSSGVQYDFDAAAERDTNWIVPLGLLVIAVILGVLLRAVVAPVVMIATVVLSFFGTLGLSLLFVLQVVGDPGVDSSLPVFAFIFLVALGIDYTIFLMSRVREEARLHGTREGMLRALTATGPVITSAGIILAGTFAVLLTLPVTFVFNIGFMVAVGILLDTFVVRTIMVPAAVELLGDKVWWPSTARGGGSGILREQPAEPAPQEHPSPAPVAG